MQLILFNTLDQWKQRYTHRIEKQMLYYHVILDYELKMKSQIFEVLKAMREEQKEAKIQQMLDRKSRQ